MTNPTRSYVDTQLFIDGQWQDAADGRSLPVFNPATGAEIGRVAHAGKADLDKAVAAAVKGFETWRDMTPAERSKIMRKAAALVRERAAEIAPLLTQENGKPLPEAKVEVLAAADITEWFAEEGFRVYGRIVPPRANLAIRQMVLKDPVGERIWFAGEALAGGLKQTAAGARLSGEAVAGQVALRLA